MQTEGDDHYGGGGPNRPHQCLLIQSASAASQPLNSIRRQRSGGSFRQPGALLWLQVEVLMAAPYLFTVHVPLTLHACSC